MSRIITLASNTVYKSLEIRENLHKKLVKAGFEVEYKYNKNSELIIFLGGDSCFLQTVRNFNFPNIPLVGINSHHLGFFPDFSSENIDTFINSYIKSDYITQEIPVLQIQITTQNGTFDILGVNELVIKENKSLTIHLKLSINDKHVQKFSGDGLIISTSAGSTAYNYSIGGSIVHPGLNVLQVAPISPINTNAYRCFTSSIICSHDSIINISPECKFKNSTLVVIDGLEYNFKKIINIRLSISQKKIKLLRASDYEFWSRVCEKFL